MYLEKINITEFRVLQDIEICFQTPAPNDQADSAETGNVINVVAGVNGCGKTSLLDAIFKSFNIRESYPLQPERSVTLSELGCIDENNFYVLSRAIAQLDVENREKQPPYDAPRIIYLPSQQSFSYQPTSQLTSRYEFCKKIYSDTILGNAEFYIKEYIIRLYYVYQKIAKLFMHYNSII